MIDLDPVKILNSKSVSRLRYAAAEALLRYFRLKAHGARHVPRQGRAIVAPNHSGFAGFDAIVLAHYLTKTARRSPRIMAHRAYFDLLKGLRAISESFGLTEARITEAEAHLAREELLLIFPEAEAGNFKSTLDRYRLRPFHTGFVRLAIKTQAPIVPCLVVGAEESSLNLGNIDLSRFVPHLMIPLPLNLIPLPAKWRIEFLPPVELSGYGPEQADDHELVTRIAEDIRGAMQSALDSLLAKRRYVYFP